MDTSPPEHRPGSPPARRIRPTPRPSSEAAEVTRV